MSDYPCYDLKEINGKALLDIKDFFENAKNPYKMKVNGIVVNVAFGGEEAPSLQSCVERLLLNKIS